jgi:hypothetical protein
MIPVAYNTMFVPTNPLALDHQAQLAQLELFGFSQLRRRFTKEEDAVILTLVATMPSGSWNLIAMHLPGRTGVQIRNRYRNYLCPDVNLNEWTPEDDAMLRRKFQEHGPQWALITKFFRNRTAANIRNHYRTMLSAENRKNASLPSAETVEKTSEDLMETVKGMELTDDARGIFDFEPLQYGSPTAETFAQRFSL